MAYKSEAEPERPAEHDHMRSAVAALLVGPPSGRDISDPLSRLLIDGTADQHIEEIAASARLSGTAKLHLLAHLKRDGQSDDSLRPLAQSLLTVDDPAERNAVTSLLLARIGDRGGDPLGRSADHLPVNGELPPAVARDDDLARILHNVVPDVNQHVLMTTPRCEATHETIAGKPALYIQTSGYSTAPLEHFRTMVDPLQWPKCPAQSAFFRKMEPQGDLEELQIPSQRGWRGIIRETVDFALGFDQDDYTMVTDLDMMYYEAADSIGCTYQFHRSEDGKINFDEGFLLVQDLTFRDIRQISTLKAVWFTEPQQNTPVPLVCPVWSAANGAIVTECVHDPATTAIPDVVVGTASAGSTDTAGPTSSAAEPTDQSPTDAWDPLFQAGLASMTHLWQGTARALTGTATATTVRQDVIRCGKLAADLVEGSARMWSYYISLSEAERPEGMILFPDGPPRFWSRTIQLVDSDETRVIDCDGFVKIGGDGSLLVGPDRVTFRIGDGPYRSRIRVPHDVDSIEVRVDMEGQRVGIYRGRLLRIDDPGVEVADPVMPAWAV